MADVVDAVTRSRMMSGIRARDTKPEKLVRSLLHRRGFRFRLHVRDLPGTPDIALPKYRATIFVHGCFWHGHDCSFFRLPATRTAFWRGKIDRNRANDLAARNALVALGWRVAVVWECALRGADANPEAIAQRLSGWLCSKTQELEIRK